MVDKCKPGDRVEIRGIYKCLANGGTINTGVFKTVLVATDIL